MVNDSGNLYLITARAGSKGVKNKNIIEIGGIPLLAFKAISAKKSNHCDRLIISTDSEEIAHIAARYGVEVPFIRPRYLAEDNSSSTDVILHAMDFIEKNENKKYDKITLLEPSSPFATYEDYNNAIELYNLKKATSVIGMKESVSSTFIAPLDEDLKMSAHYNKMNIKQGVRRQDFTQEYTMNGALYVFNWDHMNTKKNIYSDNSYGYVMKSEYSIEIDDYNDLYYATYMYEKHLDKSYWSE